MKLQCTYTGSEGNGEFIGWYKDGVDVNTEKPGHYAVSTTDKETVLTIKIFGKKKLLENLIKCFCCLFKSSPMQISQNGKLKQIKNHLHVYLNHSKVKFNQKN